MAAVVAVISALVATPQDAVAQACTTTSTNQTCTNSTALSGGVSGIADTGTPTVTNTSTGTITGSGTGVSGSTGANVTNFGTITGTALSGIFGGGATNVSNSGTVTGGAYGLNSSGASVVTNSGSMVGTSSAGIFANSTLSLSNSGSVFGGTFGLQSSGNLALSNSGSISTTSGGNSAVISGANAVVNNSGTITGGMYGISASGTATVVNTGTITAASGGNSAVISLLGITLTNYGTLAGGLFGVTSIGPINAVNFGSISGSNVGLVANNGGSILNAGSISGGITGVSASGALNLTNAGTVSGGIGGAISFDGAAQTLTLLPGSRIIGNISLGGGADTVNFNGGNHNLTFTSLTGVSVGGSNPVIVSGNRAVSFDATGFAMADRTANDVVGGISNVIGSRFTNFGSGLSPGLAMSYGAAEQARAQVPWSRENVPWPADKAERRVTVWAQGFGGLRSQPGDSVTQASNHNFWGAMIGGDGYVTPTLRLGGFAGGASAKLDVTGNVQTIDSNYGFAGLYGGYDWQRSFLNFAVIGMRSQIDTQRQINNNLAPGGVETARASYGGWSVSPEAAFGLRLPLASAVLLPTAKVRYLAAWYDGYTENGSTANLTINDRSFQSVEGRLQVGIADERGTALGVFSVNIYGGVLGYSRVGNHTVDAVALGQTVSFAAPGKSDVTGIYGGTNLALALGRSISLFAGGEMTRLDDKSTTAVGRAGVKATF